MNNEAEDIDLEDEEEQLIYKPFIILLIAVIYFVSGKLGLALALPNTNVTAIWPPSGVALAAVLLLGYPCLISVFLGSFFLNIYELWGIEVEPLTLHAVIMTSFFIALGALIQAAVGAFLIQEYLQTKKFRSKVNSILTFIFFTFISTLVNSTIGTISITAVGLIHRSEFINVWWTWWVGDTAGILLITPMVYAWILFPLQSLTKNKIIEGISLLSLMFLTVFLSVKVNNHFAYFLFPLLIWALLRFQLAGATLAIFLIDIFVILKTINGYGFFVHESLNESLISLQLFIITKISIILVLSAKISRRTSAIFVWHGSNETIRSLLENIKEKIVHR